MGKITRNEPASKLNIPADANPLEEILYDLGRGVIETNAKKQVDKNKKKKRRKKKKKKEKKGRKQGHQNSTRTERWAEKRLGYANGQRNCDSCAGNSG